VSLEVIYHGKHNCEKEEKEGETVKLYDLLITLTVCLTVAATVISTVVFVVKQKKKKGEKVEIDKNYYYGKDWDIDSLKDHRVVNINEYYE